MSGSSSSAAAAVMAPPPEYDVFLSFRGEDTRKNFTSHLHAALRRKNVKTFIDDSSLKPGGEISPELCKAIEASMIYVIIFSENYASSSWCLNELVKIMDCKNKYNHQRHVIPIFYYVEPATVRHQKETYADAFVKHQNQLVPKEIIQRWKDALTEAAGISGWDLNVARTESNFVDDIARDVLEKLDRSISSDNDNKGIVGINEHIAQIKTLLQLESEAVRIIGIWGMGGIGKTTLARALYDKLADKFESRCLVENAQQEIDRDGTYRLRQKYSSELGFSYERLKRAKVLLILDDVKISSQIQELIRGHGNFGQGSRIIVTSRDLQVLKNANADAVYEVKGMSYQDSLKLFCLNAFKQDYPLEGYKNMVQEVLEYAKGVPLALQVLGSFLYDNKRELWESQLRKLRKLRKLPYRQITDVLKLSYDGLDDEEKDIFLDIACLFVDRYEYEVVNFIDACGFYAEVGMNVLKDRGLISVVKNIVVVHDLLREMGKDIVHQQCANDPGKRSRLWDREEIYNVLKKNKGTDAIQCISFDMGTETFVQLHPEIFKSMPNLRMLYFHKRMLYFHKKFLAGQIQSNVTFSAFLESLPDGLKVLHWVGFPQRCLPLCPENLVVLSMPHSKLEQLWEDDQELPNLKRLDLRGCKQLVRIPDLSKFPNIEDIDLSNFESLTSLPIDLCELKLLKRLCLRGCSNLKTFPEIEDKVENLTELILDGTAIQELPSSLHRLVGLEELSLHGCRRLEIIPCSVGRLTRLCKLKISGCESLETFPSSIFKLKLAELNLYGCSMLKTFPEILEPAESFTYLSLSGTAIKELPSSLDFLVGLQGLNLRNCRRLEIIPCSIGRLTRLCELDISFCESLETFPSSIFKLKLTTLDLIGCSMLKTFPEILEPAESFTYLRLSGTAIKELPSSLDFLVGLQVLILRNCPRLEIIPCSIGRLTRLCKLHIIFCESLETIPSSIFKMKLTAFDLNGCPRVKYIPRIL